MKNKNIISYLSVLAIILIIGSIIAVTSIPLNQISPTINDGNSINYGSSVNTYITRVDGTIEDLGTSHNLLTNAGKEAIQDALMTGGTDAFDYIGLCNATAGCTIPAVGDTVIDNEYSACGLSNGVGSTADLGTGNWSVYKTFTATCDALTTNVTGLYNGSTSDTLLASNNFTLATLQSDDQLTVNWTIWVT